MSAAIEGRYFLANSARHVPARASAGEDRVLRVEDESGAVLAQVPRRGVRATARLASLMRRFDLPDGSRFETPDNNGADALLWALRRRRRGRFTDRLERTWPAVLASLIVVLAAGYYFAVQVVPLAGEWLARKTLPVVGHMMSEQALNLLDRFALSPSKLKPEDQTRATALFRKVAAHSKGGVGAYRLVFRDSGKLGPNAFALPDGTVVMTDSMWLAIKNDAEIEGVFGHEMSHVDHAHELQEVYEAALVPAALAIFTGDMSQVSQMTSILPGIILESSHSRAFEQQADDDGAAVLRAIGEKPSRMADLLVRLDKTDCGKQACPPTWLGNHPDTASRAARLRAEDKGPIAPREDCLRPWVAGVSLRCLGLD